MIITAFFTDSGVPATGLSPTIRIRDLSTDALVITDAAMSEVGDGHYKYDFTTYDSTKDYVIRCDGTASLSSSDRYKYAGNENYFEDVQEAVWTTPVTAYSGKNMTGAIQTLIYSDQIHVDTVSGAGAGTDFPYGTLRFPVDNFADAVSMCRTWGITRLHIHDDLNIPTGTDATDLIFETPGYMDTYITIDAGASVNRSAFRYLNLQGEVSNGDIVLVENCTVYNLDNFAGVMNNVALGEASEISLGTGTWAQIIHATAAGDAGNEPEISIGDATLNISQLTGNLKLKDKIGTDRTTINSTSSYIIIDSTCVSGSIELIGTGGFEDNSGPNCQVDTDAFISLLTIADGVWDETASEHTVIGSTGEILQNIDTNVVAASATLYNQLVTDVPGLVWEEQLGDHTNAGTYGSELATRADLFASAQTTEILPTSGGIIVGDNDSGDWTDVYGRDNVYWTIGENAAGLNVEFIFNLPSNEHKPGVFRVFGRYIGTPSTTHFMDLWAYNYESGSFEQLVIPFMPGGFTSDSQYEHEYFERNIDRDNNNEVRIRIRHNITLYNANHQLYLDFVELTSILPITAEDIAQAVWSENISGYTDELKFGGHVNIGLKRLLGLTHENIYIDNPVYDTDNNLISARVRIYSNSSDVGTANNVIGEYAITAPGDGPGKFTTWKQVKI